MVWDNVQLERIGQTPVLRISSYRADGSLRRWTPIWVVRVGDDLYIRSAYGQDGGWYRNAMRHRAARIRAEGIETDVTLVPVTDALTNTQVAQAYQAKYRDQPAALEPMLASSAAGTTVRLEASQPA